MKRTLARDAAQHLNNVVLLCGFVAAVRDQKRMQFVVLRDSTGSLQIVNDKQSRPDLAELISTLTPESAISVVGQVVPNDHVKLGKIELVMQSLTVESLADRQLPIDNSTCDEVRMDFRHLDLRLPKNHLMAQVETTLQEGFRRYWLSNGFIEIHTPKLMDSPSETRAELFELPYFGKTAYLAQSPQFYKQMAMAAGLERVFEIAPAFRADHSFTTRHATEFTSVDLEMSWIDSHEEVMAVEEESLAAALAMVFDLYGDQIRSQFGVEVQVPSLPFPRISLHEAIEECCRQGHRLPLDGDLDPAGERLIGKHVQKTYGHQFVFLTNYNKGIRPFYHMRYPTQPELTKSFDLLWKGVEISTGAQREHRLDILEKQAVEKGLNLEGLKTYLGFFRYGCPPHGGFGIGLARTIMLLLELESIRKATFLFRGPNRLAP